MPYAVRYIFSVSYTHLDVYKRQIHAREILRMREELNGILASRSGQDIEVVARDTDRDNFMSAQDAVEYGLIDEVLTREPVESK